MFGTDQAYLSVERTPAGLQLRRATCKDAFGGKGEYLETDTKVGTTELFLRVDVRPEAVCTFSYSTDGETFIPIGRAFTAVKGRWIGAKVGLFCLTGSDSSKVGHADFDWFRFE